MNLLILSRYGRMGASSRMRFYHYLPWLEANGIEITLAPLFSDAYVQGLQRNTKSPLEALRAYAGRVQALFSSRQFDLLWIEKETLPWSTIKIMVSLQPSISSILRVCVGFVIHVRLILNMVPVFILNIQNVVYYRISSFILKGFWCWASSLNKFLSIIKLPISLAGNIWLALIVQK